MSKQRRRIASVALLAAVLLGGAPTRTEAAPSNAVVHWNEVAADTVLADAATRTPSAAALYVAIVQAAVYNATMAIHKTHALYRSGLSAPSGASVDAAIATAAHDVLVEYFPKQQGSPTEPESLDGKYSAALTEIADGEAKDDGIAVGQAAAAEMIALRANDGRFARVDPPPEGDEPGEWKRTPQDALAVTPWAGAVTPFVMSAPDQFRPKGPNALTSDDYAAQWDEVRRYGVAGEDSARSPKQTEIAKFWQDNTIGQYNRAFRNLASERELSVGSTARLFAMTALTGADAMITCWNTKYHYLFWRPITAIHRADTDGNPATIADPEWVAFSTTANHPEYTSGHACLTGAVSRALAEFLGTAEINMTMDSAIKDTEDHHDFGTIAELRLEVENARIYGGDHFRVGGSDGTKAGDHVAKWGLKRNFQPR